MKKIFIFLLSLAVTDCATWNGFLGNNEVLFDKPRIHIFLYNDYKQDPDKYVSALQSAGYDVFLRNGDLPTNEKISFIIHSPGLNPSHYDEIANIIKILKSLGAERINQYEYQLGKHSYTPKNVGIYLL